MIRPQRGVLSERRAWLAWPAFAALFLLTMVCGTWKTVAPALAPTIAGSAFLCLIVGLRGGIARVLVTPVATFLGRISYSIYVFHFAVLDAVRLLAFGGHTAGVHPPWWLLPVFPATVVLTCGLAYLSKRLLDDPAIRLGHRLSDRLARGKRGAAAEPASLLRRMG